MISPRMRPRFAMRVPMPAVQAMARVRERLERSDCPCTGAIAGNHIHLNICRAQQRLWSPHLNLEILGEGKETVIHGHFGPRPDIWTFFMAIYAMSGFIALMGLLFAASQWMLGMPLWALWAVAGALVIGAVAYGLALAGQALSQEQMGLLLRYVQEAQGVGEAEMIVS